MKHVLSLILAALLLASSLTACSGGQTKETNKTETDAAETKASETNPPETDSPASTPSYDPSLITENGIAKAKIVLSPSATDLEKLAAEELQYHVAKVSGASLEVVTEAPTDALSIVLATPDSHPELAELFPEDIKWLTTLEEEDGRHWGDDGFAIRQLDGTLYLFGATPRGALNGVYDFIEENMGVLWLRAKEEIGLIYDEMPTVTVEKADYREKSPFQVRGWTADDLALYEDAARCELKFSRNKLNSGYTGLGKEDKWDDLEDMGLTPIITCHNVKRWILESPIYDPNCTEYWNTDAQGNPLPPEQSPQINFLSDRAADTIAASILAKLDAYKPTVDIKFIAVCAEDTYGAVDFLHYKEPFEYAPGQFVESGERNYLSTIFYTFLNKIARQVGEKYPDVTVGTYAYDFTRPAPKCDLEPNVGITLCPIESDMTDPITDAENVPNKLVYKDIEDWKTKLSDIIFYNYYETFLPSIRYTRPSWNRMQADMQYYAESGLQGVMSEGMIDIESPHIFYAWGLNTAKHTAMSFLDENGVPFTMSDAFAMNVLPIWLYEKLSWNPYEDVDALIVEFCDKVYGDASPYMQEYYRILEGAWMEGKETDAPTPTCRVEVIWTTGLETYIDSFIDNYNLVEFEGAADNMMTALNNALDAADEKTKEQLLLFKENLEYILYYIENQEFPY